MTRLNMTNAVQIVPITPDHVESFHRTLDFVARERRYLAFLQAPPLESTRNYVLDTIENGFPQLVVLSEHEVIGWCDVIPKNRPIYAHGGVLGMGLLPAFRGQGVGTRLISRTLEAARAFGLKRVELTVRERNLNAIALYEKIGFEKEGLQRRGAMVDGVFEDVICMAMLL
jgi:RimJ/RimL family protein N-acetyltransferase